MTLAEARDHIGAEVIRYRDNFPVEHGVITGIGRQRLPLVYVRLESKKNSVGIDPRLLELAPS